MSVTTTIKNAKEPAFGDRIRYSSSLILQAGKQFYSLTMPTDVLVNCCYVTTRDEDRDAGFQRVLDRKRAADIAQYIDTASGTIPGAVILSAQSEASLRLIGGGKTVEFTYAPKSFLVLDGQHRVYGFSLAETALRVPVVIYAGLTPTEEARLFIDINTKQRQVPNELLLDIKQLAEREDQRETVLREIFDLYAEDPNSTLIGLMSASSRQRNLISRVTFNLAFKTVLPVFNAPDSKHVFQVTNAYLAAFGEVFDKLGFRDRLTSPTVFRAVMDTFPEVARIYAAQHGKTFTKAKFAALLLPISEQITPTKFEKNARVVRDLSALFAKLIKKDFSI